VTLQISQKKGQTLFFPNAAIGEWPAWAACLGFFPLTHTYLGVTVSLQQQSFGAEITEAWHLKVFLGFPKLKSKLWKFFLLFCFFFFPPLEKRTHLSARSSISLSLPTPWKDPPRHTPADWLQWCVAASASVGRCW